MTHVAEILFIDKKRLANYAMQLDGKIPFFRRIGLKLGLSVAGIEFGPERPMTHREKSDVENCRELMKSIAASGQLTRGRPVDRDYIHTPAVRFVVEHDVLARKFIVPLSGAGLTGLTEAVLWISPPESRMLTGRGYGEGTYLYLIEDHRSDEAYSHMCSGCSALQLMIRELHQQEKLIIPEGDPLCGCNREDFRSPEDTLQQLGAKALSTRHITVLYRIRYFSDEQFFVREKTKHRSFDLIGYPIIILEGDAPAST
jgi:hypothetical protein